MGPVGASWADNYDDVMSEVSKAGRVLRAWLWFRCNVIGGHVWLRLEDHPMHHRCPLCNRECVDWVW